MTTITFEEMNFIRKDFVSIFLSINWRKTFFLAIPNFIDILLSIRHLLEIEMMRAFFVNFANNGVGELTIT